MLSMIELSTCQMGNYSYNLNDVLVFILDIIEAI